MIRAVFKDYLIPLAFIVVMAGILGTIGFIALVSFIALVFQLLITYDAYFGIIVAVSGLIVFVSAFTVILIKVYRKEITNG